MRQHDASEHERKEYKYKFFGDLFSISTKNVVMAEASELSKVPPGKVVTERAKLTEILDI